MVYYTVLGLTLTGLVLLVKTGMEKEWVHLGKTVGVLVFAGILGGLANYSHLKSSQDFAKSTMRGGAILESETAPEGLAWDYAMSWSYGNLDLFNLIEYHVLLQDLAFDDLRGFSGELILAAWDQALPLPKEEAHRLTRVEKHLDRNPVGQPADCSSYQRSAKK